jgi:ubiquinone/menaquinone biosynthesis C-methylase UbiE
MAEQFPQAEVIGTDLSPIQPVMVVPNCTFQVDDAEQEWSFQKDYFDFIHSRTLAQSIRDWPKYLKQMYKHTKPGGYIELAELATEVHSDDNSMKPDSAFVTWINTFNEACRRANLRVVLSDGHKVMVKECEEAGFVDVVASKIKQPFGSWPKDPHLKHGKCSILLDNPSWHLL